MDDDSERLIPVIGVESSKGLGIAVYAVSVA
jgi:hypothetical protein